MKALATLERTLPCKRSSMKSKKKKQQQQQIRWAVFHLSTNHIPVCTAASLLTCRPSAAQLDIHSPILTHKLRISSFGLFLERWLGSGFKGTGGNWRWVLDV